MTNRYILDYEWRDPDTGIMQPWHHEFIAADDAEAKKIADEHIKKSSGYYTMPRLMRVIQECDRKISLYIENLDDLSECTKIILRDVLSTFDYEEKVWQDDRNNQLNGVKYIDIIVSLASQEELIDNLLDFSQRTEIPVCIFDLHNAGLNGTSFTILPNSEKDWAIRNLESGLRAQTEYINRIVQIASNPLPIPKP